MAKQRRKLRTRCRPGYDGRMEQTSDKVESPYRKGEFEVVARNVRESGLLTMLNRKQIDDAQYMAGDWIRRKIERTRMSSGAIDPGYEPVDTSGHADPIPDRVIAAAQALGPVERHVTREHGRQGWLTVRLVCAEGATVSEAAHRRYGLATRAQERATGQLLRDALDEAAIYLGYAQRPHKPRNVVDKARA
ncbi:MAG: hypothetical protein GY948_16395 [Alphaproteobacteria bacterium]|nr:hypothetical protein [Alphaproteobacteria bacterium]